VAAVRGQVVLAAAVQPDLVLGLPQSGWANDAFAVQKATSFTMSIHERYELAKEEVQFVRSGSLA
jgi:hypothetical protein